MKYLSPNKSLCASWEELLLFNEKVSELHPAQFSLARISAKETELGPKFYLNTSDTPFGSFSCQAILIISSLEFIDLFLQNDQKIQSIQQIDENGVYFSFKIGKKLEDDPNIELDANSLKKIDLQEISCQEIFETFDKIFPGEIPEKKFEKMIKKLRISLSFRDILKLRENLAPETNLKIYGPRNLPIFNLENDRKTRKILSEIDLKVSPLRLLASTVLIVVQTPKYDRLMAMNNKSFYKLSEKDLTSNPQIYKTHVDMCELVDNAGILLLDDEEIHEAKKHFEKKNDELIN